MPANDFYDSTGYPSNGALGVAATMRSELDLIEAGFNKLPGLAASANLPIFGNSGGTALEPKSAADARTLLDVYSKAETPTLPVGCIVAFVGGYFTNGANAGFTNVIGDTASAVNTLLNSSGWYVCNGAAINIPTSSIFNGANRYLPNLSDSRFLMGSTGAGTIGGATTHTHTTGNFTLSTNEIPSHAHTFVAVQGGAQTTTSIAGTPYDQAYFTKTTSSVGSGAAHNHGATAATDNRPLFVSCHYIMKVI